ncbi:MBL fold metallo-hydrolase [Domibacillus sp. DTU_2020_1001157_1_SI_ALB_TIR_016]|uniref:MBL fold metallo-hydrolase n=1 Tax=Domibacillus sp. DTU_2020_1001157_1_SI_ALB_TIR_016 TaxID=3077789 RepID=UPI0028EC306A|nr:MBL fold metallo-hydrolase [Domibacillus sp. DTU_2020_1001157_1_SI_ALB_TIR_016]WNS78185.1 MBL fold metallo-hydrolase [Domibacillus sp. DTU_2020_1001157_1_SI_ALB_TIR_016]
MKITDGIEMLSLEYQVSGQKIVLNPTLLWDEEAAILVDTGMPGALHNVSDAIKSTGLSFGRLKNVILTHQDLDHIGNLPDLINESKGTIRVSAHKLDQPYIEGSLPLIKTDAKRMSKEFLASLPEHARALYYNPPVSKVDETIEDGEELPYCGGVRVIHTPGHTPGHLCLYVKQSKVLIAGDALVCSEGTLRGPVEQTTLDMGMAYRSLDKLLDLEIDTIICYHGGVCSANAKDQLHDLIRAHANT